MAYIKRHHAIKFRKLNPTLLIQNYLFTGGGGGGGREEEKERKREKKKDMTLNVSYCLSLMKEKQYFSLNRIEISTSLSFLSQPSETCICIHTNICTHTLTL